MGSTSQSATDTRQSGFTLLEVMLVMALLATLAGAAVINLIRPQASAVSSISLEVLTADLRSQQLRAMSGESGSGGTLQPHGIKFENDRYILFRGSSFDQSDPDNFTVETETGLTLSTTLPSSVIIFSNGSGEVQNYTEGADTITIHNSSTGESRTVAANRLGVMRAVE